MLTDTSRWSHARGNTVVPSRWQATRFSTAAPELTMSEQLKLLWMNCARPRMYVYVGRMTDGEELIPGGTNNAEIGDRVLYSQIAHADDATELLQHIDTDTQLWALASLVGDWVAVIAHQQAVMHMVRPDLCSEIVEWPGSPKTIFDRMGVVPQEHGS